MQRKIAAAPGFPANNSCSIRMPDAASTMDSCSEEPDSDQQHRRQQLVNFAHSHWGFKNWSWAVTKQELDFVDYSNGKYCAGVVAFVSVTVKSMDIHREDIGYATTQAAMKGSAIFQARKCAVTNALRETLLSFGGAFATALIDLLESQKPDVIKSQLLGGQENNQNVANKVEATEPKNAPNLKITRNDSSDSAGSRETPVVKSPLKNKIPAPQPTVPFSIPVAKTLPMPANHAPPLLTKPAFPPANQTPQKPLAPTPAPTAPFTHIRPNNNVSFLIQPLMPGMLPQMYAQPPPAQPRMPFPQHVFPNYYDYAPAPWHFGYEGYDRHHGNVNLNFNMPPKNLVVNSRAGTVECKNSSSPGEGPGEEHVQHNGFQTRPSYNPGSNGACWIKPTCFHDGFWTERKVKKWVAEQVEKQFPEDVATPPPAAATPHTHGSHAHPAPGQPPTASCAPPPPHSEPSKQ